MNDQYLWDRSGSPDPEIVRLEEILAPFGFPAGQRSFNFSANAFEPKRPAWVMRVLVGALAAISVAAFVVFGWYIRTPDWKLLETSGTVLFDRLRSGGSLYTGTGSRARIQVSDIGEVSIAGEAQLRFVESGKDRRRLVLEYGELHARISAPPGVFVVDTPRVRATDMGCEYILAIDRQGNGLLRVMAGWVALDASDSQSLVPQGAQAAIRSGGRFSAPIFNDAPAVFREAVEAFSFEHDRNALETALREARPRDALTLLNLFRGADREERFQLFDRLNQFVPAPPGITRDQMDHWRITTNNDWWTAVEKAQGLQFIKKQKTLRLK